MNLRVGVRALIVDQDDSVLLARFDWDGLDIPGGFWANPGGGVEPGESRRDALARELMEEVGLELAELGQEVWTKTAYFPLGSWDGQIDHIHLVRVEHFLPSPQLTRDQLLAENVHEIRWWTPEEVATTSATFAPRALPDLLSRLLAAGATSLEPVAIVGF